MLLSKCFVSSSCDTVAMKYYHLLEPNIIYFTSYF